MPNEVIPLTRPWMLPANALLGQAEVAGRSANPVIVELFRVSGQDFDSDETAWCMAFVNGCLVCSGYLGTNSALASSALTLGEECPPEPGCVVVFYPLSAGASGHVGFLVEKTATHVRVLGGNQNNQVKVSTFAIDKVRAYRMPKVRTSIPQTTLPTVLTLAPHEYEDVTVVALPKKQDNFMRVQEVIKVAEGGFSDHPVDRGGPTNYGITIGTLSDYLGRPATREEVKSLTYDKALTIFRQFYWIPIRGDELPIAFALMTYNARVNSGPKDGERFLQRALNKQGAGLDVDGEIGPLTIAASWKVANIEAAIKDFSAQYEAYYRSLSTFPTFGKGWLNRLKMVTTKALAWAKEKPMPDVPQSDTLNQILELLKKQQQTPTDRPKSIFERIFSIFRTPSNAAVGAAGAGAVLTPILQNGGILGSLTGSTSGSFWMTIIGAAAGLGLFGRFSTMVTAITKAVDLMKKQKEEDSTS